MFLGGNRSFENVQAYMKNNLNDINYEEKEI